jgi:hypothetical protein
MTKETMTWLLWSDAVLTEARCSFDQSRPHRARMQAAYNAGETVAMAANELRLRVKAAAMYDQADNEEQAMRAAIRRGRGGGRSW